MSTIRAERDPSFYRRFWLMAIGAVAFALYCVYDGAIAWPNQRVRALKYLEFKEEAQTLNNDWLREWREYAREQGWPTGDPGEPKKEVDFQAQFAMAGLCGVVAMALLAKVLLSLGRWVEADDAAIKTSWGQSVPFDKVQSVDKRIWQKKGIARIYYDADGRKRRFVLDNYKFRREPTDAIMRRLEANIPAEKIKGGPPEPTDAPANSTDASPEARASAHF